MKKLILVAGLALGAFAAAPASALPVAKITGAESAPRADSVAWYCNGKGHCVQGVRPGYVVRQGWAPTCVGDYYWDGYRCAVRIRPAPVVVVKPAKPVVVVKPAPVVVKPAVKVKVY
ncbi:hypothetical protein [Prosthecomicrobium sp. N25]|uniref:hypothetical protein n=1 Tax=Prosthecomicrobium sp. N25 TaxID=3129254 RepID=UPI003076B538